MKVFIGSSQEAVAIMDKVAILLEEIGFVVLRWKDNESFILGRSITDNLSYIVNSVDAAIFIYSEDDRNWYRGSDVGVPRDNVLFEHGVFAGKLGLSNTVIIKHKQPKMPSDLDGIIYAEYEEAKPNTLKAKLELWKHKIEQAACEKCSVQKLDESKNRPKANDNNQKIECVNINHGTYHRIIDEQKIILHNPFSVSKYLITQSVYSAVMGENPSNFKGDNLPVEQVSFRNAIEFCNKLSVNNGLEMVYTIINNQIQWNKDAKGYRLPFETEWEYALNYNKYFISENLNSIAWYQNNSDSRTHDVGDKKANDRGIFDLLGNVWEWCFDNYMEKPPLEIMQNYNEKTRVLRGGSFVDFESMFVYYGFRKKANETTKNKFTGFRVVLQNYL